MKTPAWRLPSHDYPEHPQLGLWVTIYPPNTWMGRSGFHVFVGGNGIGQTDTLEEAIKLARTETINHLKRRISNLISQAEHAVTQLDTIVMHDMDAFQEKDKEYT